MPESLLEKLSLVHFIGRKNPLLYCVFLRVSPLPCTWDSSLLTPRVCHQMCGFYPHTKQCTPVGCPTIELNSTSRRHQIPQVKGLSPSTLLHPIPDTNCKYQVSRLPTHFYPIGSKSEVPMTLSSGSMNLLGWLTTQGTHYLHLPA